MKHVFSEATNFTESFAVHYDINGASNLINTLRPKQNGWLFADDMFKRIFLNEDICISNKISLKYVPRGLIDNMSTLVQIMAWRRPGDKPLSEPMMIGLLTHICVTRPRWVKMVSMISMEGMVVGSSGAIPWPLRAEVVFSMDLSSMKVE